MKGIANKTVVGNYVYTAPLCRVVEVYSEGFLCVSGLEAGGYHDGIYGDDDPLI